MKHIVFFMSAADVAEKYMIPSLELIHASVSEGYGFIFGGSQTGMMKRASDTVQSLGGSIIAVTCKLFLDKCLTNHCEQYIAEDVPERKKVLIQRSQAVVALPGGTGTFDEITDAIEARKFGVFKGPIVLLNIDRFWDGMISQYERMYRDDFLAIDPEKLFYIANSSEHAMDYIRKNV